MLGVCVISDKEVWLVMELGESLRHVLETKAATLAWNEKWKMASDAAQAVAYLHQQGIIHRNLKR